jgi:hypothetical protein
MPPSKIKGFKHNSRNSKFSEKPSGSGRFRKHEIFLLTTIMPETANKTVVAPSKVWESRHLPFPVDRVWDHIRPLNFSFSSIVKDVKVQGAEAEGKFKM